MPAENERQVKELAEIKSAEMMQIQGGAWYAEVHGVGGTSAHACGGGGAGKVQMRDLDFI